MRDQPPEDLVELLERLHLSSRAQVQSVAPRVRRLACELPLFNSVWIDSLVQTQLLSHYQAAEINAGRGDQLIVGPLVIQKRLQQLGYADCFLAKTALQSDVRRAPSDSQLQNKSGPEFVHLFVARGIDPVLGTLVRDRLTVVIDKLAGLDSPAIASIKSIGSSGDSVWAAYARTEGFPVIDWLSSQGRLPADTVLEIARQMSSALSILEEAGLSHGDISASTLWISPSGRIQIGGCGFRAALRQAISQQNEPADLQSLEYTAPELLGNNQPDKVITAITDTSGDERLVDFYACGCLWWHLLAGRPPFAGGNRSAKIAAIQSNRITDIRQIAPDTSSSLAETIQHCTRADTEQRPRSFREIAEQLGAPTQAGKRRLAAELLGGGRSTIRPRLPARLSCGVRRAAQPILAATACGIIVAAATSPLWRSRPLPSEQAVSRKMNLSSEPVAENDAVRLVRRFGLRTSAQMERHHQGTVDGNVHQVAYQTPDAAMSQSLASKSTEESRPVIELAGSSETLASSLQLQRDSIVRGKLNARTAVIIPSRGLAVTADHLRFENIDFVWHTTNSQFAPSEPTAMFDVRVAFIEFVGCTFQASQVGLADPPVAIRLTGIAQNRVLAPSSQVSVERCVIGGVAAGCDCAASGPVAIEIKNTLFLGSGPLIRFASMRRADAPTEISLNRVTARNSSSIFEFDGYDKTDEAGSINIKANDCVFAPTNDGALLSLTGHGAPKAISTLLKSIAWNGRGSLADPKMAIVQQQTAAARESVSDDELALDGIVSSTFEFEGTIDADPRSSRLRKWLAPLDCDQPPGIGDDLPSTLAAKTPSN